MRSDDSAAMAGADIHLSCHAIDKIAKVMATGALK